MFDGPFLGGDQLQWAFDLNGLDAFDGPNGTGQFGTATRSFAGDGEHFVAFRAIANRRRVVPARSHQAERSGKDDA